MTLLRVIYEMDIVGTAITFFHFAVFQMFNSQSVNIISHFHHKTFIFVGHLHTTVLYTETNHLTIWKRLKNYRRW